MADDKKTIKDMPIPDKKGTVLLEVPFKVEALTSGFYKRQRKVAGDVFEIEGEHQLGKWMKKI